MHAASRARTQQRLSIDFITIKHASLKSVYVAPVSGEPLLWRGVIFVRKGPYASAVLRFEIAFPIEYPARPPNVTFLSDVFHPLIAPLTTYTYSTRDQSSETISASVEKLPPGGLSLRHGFPEWYDTAPASITVTATDDNVFNTDFGRANEATDEPKESPHIIEVLQYMRIVLDTETVLDTVPVEMAANTGAWHAWRSYRAKMENQRSTMTTANAISRDRSMSPSKTQPGGARKPGEWSWNGVWEDRVKKAVQSSISEATLYGGDAISEIDFLKMDTEAYNALAPVAAAHSSEIET